MNQKPSQSRLALRRSHAAKRVARSARLRCNAISAIEVLTLLPDAALFSTSMSFRIDLGSPGPHTTPASAGSAAPRPEHQGSAIDALQLALRDRDRALHVL